MGRFPENDLQVFDDYLPGNVTNVFVAAQNHLFGQGVPSPERIFEATHFPPTARTSRAK